MKIETVKNPKQGLEIVKRILYKNVDPKTVLFLSGGTTPKPLYKLLAQEKKLHVGAVAVVDERYKPPLHKDSNERMIRDTGLIGYLSSKNIPFHSILNFGYSLGSNVKNVEGSSLELLRSLRRAQVPHNDIEDIVEDYGGDVDYLLSYFPKRIAIMGIGEDGHTAGLPAGNGISILRQAQDKNQKYVIGINDFPGEFKERITLTFKALAKMDLLIVLVFGKRKREVLRLMFEKGSVEEFPARFYNLPEISKKTIVITDQKV